jgi:hypothetical protein
MIETIAKKLADTAETCQITINLRESYSGRGMFGKTTWAIDFDSWNDFTELAVETAGNMEQTERRQFLQAIKRMRSDSMGLGIVVY